MLEKYTITREQEEPLESGITPVQDVLVFREYPGCGADDPRLFEDLPEAYLVKPSRDCLLEPGDLVLAVVEEDKIDPHSNPEVRELLRDMIQADTDEELEQAFREIEVFQLVITQVAGEVCKNCPLNANCPIYNPGIIY
jgi:hypothetical protein